MLERGGPVMDRPQGAADAPGAKMVGQRRIKEPTIDPVWVNRLADPEPWGVNTGGLVGSANLAQVQPTQMAYTITTNSPQSTSYMASSVLANQSTQKGLINEAH